MAGAFHIMDIANSIEVNYQRNYTNNTGNDFRATNPHLSNFCNV